MLRQGFFGPKAPPLTGPVTHVSGKFARRTVFLLETSFMMGLVVADYLVCGFSAVLAPGMLLCWHVIASRLIGGATLHCVGAGDRGGYGLKRGDNLQLDVRMTSKRRTEEECGNVVLYKR